MAKRQLESLLEELAAQELPAALAKRQLESLREELNGCRQRLRRIEQELNRLGKAHAGVRLLRTIPGVGPRTAEAVMAYIDEPKRFNRSSRSAVILG